MLAIVMIVRVPKGDGPSTPAEVTSLAVDGFEQITDLRLEDGWSPRFSGAQDPDQGLAWPFEGGFGLPWEPASPYLADQGVALNGPGGRSEVALWRGLEWRRTRFDAPLASARLKGSRLLVTLRLAADRFETRLIEVPEGRVIWSTRSGPWSRFSWDGKAVLLGLLEKDPKEPRAQRLLLASLPLDGEPGEATLAPWNEEKLGPAPRGWVTAAERLSDDQKELPGDRLLVPWAPGGHLAFVRRDRLWTAAAGRWILWRLKDGAWRREAEGEGALLPQPPQRLGFVRLEGEEARRFTTPLEEAAFTPVPEAAEPWPAPDPAWAWAEEGALTPWDLRWGRLPEDLGPERQRASVQQAFRADWNAAKSLRASVKGWLPSGPEVALRELQGVAWCWVGDRVILARLTETARVRRLRKLLGS
jgi:hypothetical protein